jgi:hypothetical protein
MTFRLAASANNDGSGRCQPVFTLYAYLIGSGGETSMRNKVHFSLTNAFEQIFLCFD